MGHLVIPIDDYEALAAAKTGGLKEHSFQFPTTETTEPERHNRSGNRDRSRSVSPTPDWEDKKVMEKEALQAKKLKIANMTKELAMLTASIQDAETPEDPEHHFDM